MSTTFTNESLLSLLQISDSFFPLGGYSLSFGLETLSQLGALKKKDNITSLLSVFIEQLSTLDCPATRSAYQAAENSDLKLIVSIDRKLASFKNVKEFYESSKRSGRSLIRTVRTFMRSKLLNEYSDLVESKNAPGTYPVSLGLVCHELGINEERTVFLMMYTLMISILGAAVRLGHITHVEVQGIIHSSKEALEDAAAKSSTISWNHARTFSPALDIMGMQHVYLQAKMFAC